MISDFREKKESPSFKIMSFLNRWCFSDRSLGLAAIVSVFFITLIFILMMIVDSHGMEKTGLKMIAVELFDTTPPHKR